MISSNKLSIFVQSSYSIFFRITVFTENSRYLHRRCESPIKCSSQAKKIHPSRFFQVGTHFHQRIFSRSQLDQNFCFVVKRMFSSEFITWKDISNFGLWLVQKFSFQSNLGILFLNVYISYENDDLVMKCKTTVHPSTFLLIQSQSGARLFIGSFVTITYVNLLKTERREI